MKNRIKYCCIVIFAGMALQCSNALNSTLLNELQGRWAETYCCTSQSCNSPLDSIHTSYITFDGKKFSTVLYNDSGQQIEYDTSFSGTCIQGKDSIIFILDHFEEIFYFVQNNNELTLYAKYSIDINGTVIEDFHSILWCCDMKKRGRFIKQ